jgi:hypothetical protein
MAKRNVLLGLAALLIATGSAYAQSITFNAPFQFTLGTTLMPAGEYSVESHSRTLTIRDLGRGAVSFASTSAVKSLHAQSQTKVVFRCYGGACFLAQGWIEGNDSGWNLAVNRQERRVANHDPALRLPVLAALP